MLLRHLTVFVVGAGLSRWLAIQLQKSSRQNVLAPLVDCSPCPSPEITANIAFESWIRGGPLSGGSRGRRILSRRRGRSPCISRLTRTSGNTMQEHEEWWWEGRLGFGIPHAWYMTRPPTPWTRQSRTRGENDHVWPTRAADLESFSCVAPWQNGVITHFGLFLGLLAGVSLVGAQRRHNMQILS